ncbi:MAG TPA: right-handed parallel beta-helix repeat-containing protein [Bryobacteraceae bacterium]|nr:right-handed parallel beta-helix repeat-containing protein [Bryobacteraceae bacterium]
MLVRKQIICSRLPLFFLGTVCALVNAEGQTRIVGHPGAPCPNVQYASIGAAVNAASAGDVIEICPGTYQEQLIVSKPLTLRGIEVNGVKRTLIQPALSDLAGLATEAVITVMNTTGVKIQDLVIDASHNTVNSCTPGLAGVHFFNASGALDHSAIVGAHLANPLGCSTNLPFGNGVGVQVDTSQSGTFHVSMNNNTIHSFTAYGVEVTGVGVTANISQNTISGVGPSSGFFQFGIFIFNGAIAQINSNVITEGLCGSLTTADCINQRSEGITLRAIGDGTVVDGNIIDNAQSGIFINGANKLRVTNNQIGNIDGMSGMDIQATASGVFTNSLVSGNTISHVGPIDQDASNDEEGCGINEYSGTGTFSGNQMSLNTVNDAYCGVAHVAADNVESGTYFNTLYTELNSDQYPSSYPPPTEP